MGHVSSDMRRLLEKQQRLLQRKKRLLDAYQAAHSKDSGPAPEEASADEDESSERRKRQFEQWRIKKVEEMDAAFAEKTQLIEKKRQYVDELVDRRRQELEALFRKKNHELRAREKQLLQQIEHNNALLEETKAQKEELKQLSQKLRDRAQHLDEFYRKAKEERAHQIEELKTHASKVDDFKQKYMDRIAQVEKNLETIKETEERVEKKAGQLRKEHSVLRKDEERISEMLRKLKGREGQLQEVLEYVEGKTRNLRDLRDDIASRSKVLHTEMQKIEKARDMAEKIPRLRRTYRKVSHDLKEAEHEAVAKKSLIEKEEQQLDRATRALRQREQALAQKETEEASSGEAEETPTADTRGEGTKASVKDIDIIRDYINQALQLIKEGRQEEARDYIESAQAESERLDEDSREKIRYDILEARTELRLSQV